MSNASWIAKRLGNQAPQAPARPAPTPQFAGGFQTQQPSPVPQALVQQQLQTEITGQENYQTMVQAIEQQTGEAPTILKMSRHWKGGPGMKTEGHLRCPSCDSLNIFTRSTVRIMNEKTGASGHAKPRCFDCGWTQDFMPGDRSNWS
jgi:hypothetical protein